MEQFIQAFFTWGVLATIAGATAATVVITQLLKGVKWIEQIPTRIFSYIVALIVLIAATLFSGPVTASAILLCVINAAVVALAAQGGFNVISSGLNTSKYADAQEPDYIVEPIDEEEKEEQKTNESDAAKVESKIKPPDAAD